MNVLLYIALFCRKVFGIKLLPFCKEMLIPSLQSVLQTEMCREEWCLLGCYAVWLL
jgi:hypothetical protein